MDMLQIQDKTIFYHASSSEAYKKGLLYNLNHRVRHFEFDSDKLIINAIVRGSEDYDVSIYFDNKGDIQDYECTCPAYYNYSGACKHIVAVMKMAQGELLKYKYINPARQRNNTYEDVFAFFESFLDENPKQEVHLEITYEFNRDYFNSHMSSLELRLGTDRLYIVKNMKEFLAHISANTPLEFGKNFTFDPEKHTFSKEDQKIIDILMEIYENERLLEQRFKYTYQTTSSVFVGKKVLLSTPYLLRVFEALKNRNFIAKVLNNGEKLVSITEEDLPLNFSLSHRNNRLLLNLKSSWEFVSLTEKGIYFYYNGKIYRPSEKQQKCYIPLISKFLGGKTDTLPFPANQTERFISEVLPHVHKIGKVSMDKGIEEKLVKEKLVSKIYFDKYKEGISAVINFHYGQSVVNPFSGQNYINDPDKIVVRDMESERKIIEIFETAEFIVDKNTIYLTDESKLFEFLRNGLTRLQELAEVYYSDAFKSISVRFPPGFSGGIRLSQDSNMLEFSFDYEDIDSSELEHIFSSIKEKKKYYRLKDGSFLPLDLPELISMSNLVEQLDIKEKDLSKKIIELPKYRAIYIDSLLRESNMNGIERSLDFKHMVQNIKEPGDMDFEIPEKLKNILRDYQKVGYKWLKTLAYYGLSGILADDMGLGKTLQVIAFILSEKDKAEAPSLVVAPTSLVYNWQEEVKKFAPELKTLVISGSISERHEKFEKIKDVDIVVTSYPLLRRDIDLYKEIKFQYCFLDEAQHIKNPNTLNAKTAKQINSGMNFALTGTPIENSITELWSIFDFVMPGYLLSHSKFLKKFETPITKYSDQNALNELGRHIRPFILRRLKKDVLKDLPEKIETKIVCEMTENQKKIYLAYLKKAKSEVAIELQTNGFEKSQIKILALLTRLRQICCHPSLFIENYSGESGKIQVLEEIMTDAFDSGHRILLFSQFTSMLEIIKQFLDQKSVEYFYLDGSTKAEDRVEMVKSFNQGARKLFLISLKAGGTGLNLTGADMVIHFDPWWNPAVEDQASDRAHRIGQKNVVQVMKLITQGTIEDKIFELQQKKKEMIDSVIQPGETLLSKMSESEILELFEL
ncbi:MAG TPA: DEAD/DEAH box helicase [Acetivibrio sp.]|uniref:DEAD/DEAH box helicase n=1 Tax=Acetivibrio sp. TaxID=1872092 RepID=UPI002B84D80F|nr:DEAD/DEAH box helicase [Acetivibrio sp.]HOM01566.1 DEAD/DEAH box helicase [Acetivibrio sp.]